MDDLPSFSSLAGFALIVLAVIGPMAYCTAHLDGPVSGNALVLECIKARGQWKAGPGWADPYYCEFPKAALSQ